jgi:hypothetical protein
MNVIVYEFVSPPKVVSIPACLFDIIHHEVGYRVAYKKVPLKTEYILESYLMGVMI